VVIDAQQFAPRARVMALGGSLRYVDQQAA
jgi:hypothetical protein